MRIAVSSDLDEPVARFAVHELRRRGHEVTAYGTLRDGDPEGAGRPDWAVAEGRAAYTADGARRWNDANVLAIGLRLTSRPLLTEILDAWLSGTPSTEADDLANIAHLGETQETTR